MSLQFDVFFNRKKRVWAMKNTFLLLNNVISILDLFKILTYYIDNKKILEIRITKTIFFESSFTEDSKK